MRDGYKPVKRSSSRICRDTNVLAMIWDGVTKANAVHPMSEGNMKRQYVRTWSSVETRPPMAETLDTPIMIILERNINWHQLPKTDARRNLDVQKKDLLKGGWSYSFTPGRVCGGCEAIVVSQGRLGAEDQEGGARKVAWPQCQRQCSTKVWPGDAIDLQASKGNGERRISHYRTHQ